MDKKVKGLVATVFPQISIGLLIIAFAYIIISNKDDVTRFANNSLIESHKAVLIETVGVVDVPYNMETEKGKTYIVRDTIPENVSDNYGMMIYSNYSKQKIYVGDKVIGSYATKKSMVDSNLVGNVRIIVPIEKSMAGEKVIIVTTPFYDQRIDYNAPVYGNMDALVREVIHQNIGRIIMMIMLFTMCILSFELTVYIKISKSNININALKYFVFLLISIMIWMFCDSDLPQFFTNANMLISFISFLVLALMGVAFNGFCEQTFHEEKKIFRALVIVGWILPLINVLVFLGGICDPMTLLPLTHMYFVITMLICGVIAIRDWKKSADRKIFCISVYVMIFTVIIGLILYYIRPTTGRSGFVLGLGLLLFSTGLMLMAVQRIIGMVEINYNANMLRELAYEDLMTGLGNRSSFEKFFDDVENMGIEGKTVTLFMFDLNFLKKTNDEFGHKAGDKMLIGLAKCIEKTFNKKGTSYRLGGDEFASIIVGNADQILNILGEFKNKIEEYNKYNEHAISTAIGYSTRKYHRGDLDFYNRLFREADDAMYSNKVRMHEELGAEVRNKKD